MSLSRFRAQPRKGHLDRAKRIVGYLLFLPDGAIRFRTGEPDFSPLKDQEYDWTRSVYSGACEQIPHDIPKPLGKHVQTTHYVDANLHHDLATGKTVTAVLHFLNQTPIDAYTKRQSTVETRIQRTTRPSLDHDQGLVLGSFWSCHCSFALPKPNTN